MKQFMPHVALAALLGAGVIGCATDSQNAQVTVPVQPVVQSQPQIIEGQVVRIDGDSYVVRETSGRQTRVLLDRNTMHDNIAVGDAVIARFDGPPSSPYATSVTRRTVNPLPPSVATLPRPKTVEGVIQRQDGNDYVIRDISGKEVRLQVDNTTRLDGNITAGDKVIAVTSTMPSDAPYVANIYRLGNPNLIQGEVVRIDGDSYVVRDQNGRETRLNTNSSTVRNDNITVGDRIIAYTGLSSTVHADSIAKR
jgi:uncharacterized protein YdeI (BOF family)